MADPRTFPRQARKVLIRVEDLKPDHSLGLLIDSPSIEGNSRIEVTVLSPRRSRVRVDLEVKPKTLAARLFINTMRLAKGRVQARFEKGLVQLGARIRDRYDRQA